MQQEEPMSPKLESLQPVLMSRDVEASIAFYRRLGFDVTFRDDPKTPKYAGVSRDGIELHLQWHDASEWEFPNDRPTYRFVVRDVDGLFAEFRERGALSVNSAVRDTPWGTREFHVQDPDRNGLQFYRSL
jgi:catechol 2,3-dioxygenase-like lactoylglutathione lyase family enzyme